MDFQDHSLRIITWTVISIHAFGVIFAMIMGPSEKSANMPPPPRFVVQTVTLSPPAPIQKTQELVAEAAPPEPEPEVKEAAPEPPKPTPPPPPPEPKKVEKPVIPPKKPEPKKPEPKKEVKPPPKPEPKKTPPPKVEKKPVDAAAEQKRKDEIKQKKEAEQQAERTRQQKLLAQAQERIAKIDGNRHKAAPGTTGNIALSSVPKAITSLQIDTLPTSPGGPALSAKEISYRDELAGRLKLLLRLPEYGDVKVKLTLDRAGKVVTVAIVSAESAANKKYIEKTLPDLTFPAFGASFGSDAQYTFSITLSNEL